MMDILKVALSQYGVTETKGRIDNPEVMKYYHETGRTWVNHDETPWCDAFLDWCAMTAGLKWSPGLNARGWLKEGEKVDPQEVDDLALEIPIVVVFWRKSIESIYGHTGLFVRKNDSAVWTLGGNQGIGQVNISPYPEIRVLGYRRLWK
ncbi:MAG TPA: TIGR02594 family protein [Candidatus Scalindua sp.]|nr:TIGR02594 family protein [Candidatus Scalindua sp.]